jgi:hypothetical protein
MTGWRLSAFAGPLRPPAIGSAPVPTNLSVPAIVALHDDALSRWEPSLPRPDDAALEQPQDAADASLRELVEAGHFANFTIWGLEDEARRRDVGDARIAAVKRAIDPWNQRRNDLMEAIDAAVLAQLANVDVASAELHSETAGMMIDRLSILALKIRNAARVGADASAHGDTSVADDCAARGRVLRDQREDLAACLARLLEDFAAGRRHFKSYLQLKAYNDERLNPVLRAAARDRAAGR